MQPFSDDFLEFEESSGRYYLTLKDVQEYLGIDLTARAKDSVSINAILRLASNHVYNYIHQFNDNRLQDYIISHTDDGRRIIKKAMEEQLTYILTVGDLSRTTDLNKRKLWFDENAKNILENEVIKETGTTICYCGRYRLRGVYGLS